MNSSVLHRMYPKPKSLNQSTENTTQQALPKFQCRFYRLLDQEGRDGIGKFLKVLDEKTTLKDRMLCIHEKLTHFNLLQEKYKQDHKNDQTANGYIAEGNTFFVTGQYSKALKSYTKSLMTAQGQQVLSMTYAYRSAALFKLKLYRECLTDIERAFANNYPENLKPKLIDRRAKATELLEGSNRVSKFYEEVPTINEINPNIPCATSSIEIQECRTGEKVITTKTLEIGDVISVEEPITVIVCEKSFFHCHECIELCYNPIPCKSCTEVLYCSEACMKKAYLSYHNYQCPILLSLRHTVGNSILISMAVKMIFQYGEQLSDEIFHLIRKVQNEKFEEQIQLEIAAAVIYELIKKYTTKFDGPNGEALENSFKDNIVALFQVCELYATALLELCPDKDNTEAFIVEREVVAVAIYPFFAKIRHSCAPNAFPHHHGTKRVLRAIRTIKEGKELLISFGAFYTQHPKEARQKMLLEEYHFKCTCRACRKKHWTKPPTRPTTASLSKNTIFLTQIRKNPDVAVARRKIPEKIKEIKNLERFEPNVDLSFEEMLLLHCYDVLGNKRLIL